MLCEKLWFETKKGDNHTKTIFYLTYKTASNNVPHSTKTDMLTYNFYQDTPLLTKPGDYSGVPRVSPSIGDNGTCHRSLR